MRRFEIDMGWDSYAVIDLHEKVIDVVDDQWRSMLYDLHTPEEIAGHIAWNLIVNNATLTMLDGWADLSNDMAKIVDIEWSDWKVKEIEYPVEEN